LTPALYAEAVRGTRLPTSKLAARSVTGCEGVQVDDVHHLMPGERPDLVVTLEERCGVLAPISMAAR